jgi:hypothetical protein
MNDKAIPPLSFRWDGEALIPRYPKMADQHLTIGETYVMVEHLDRSEASHRHFFVCVNEAFKNLPERFAGQFANPDSLRKHALIMTGFCDTRSIVCSSKAEAQRLAAFIRPVDPDSVVVVHEAMVQQLTAQSQSYRSMGKDRFGESKSAVLTYLAEMMGVEAATLSANAGRSA